MEGIVEFYRTPEADEPVDVDPSRLSAKSIEVGRLLRDHKVAERSLAKYRASLARTAELLDAGVRVRFQDSQAQTQLQNFKEALLSQAGIQQILDRAAGIKSITSLIDQFVADATRIAVQLREHFQSIRIILPKLDHFWTDVFQAEDGDVEAARRLAAYIPWRPNQWQQEAQQSMQQDRDTLLVDVRDAAGSGRPRTAGGVARPEAARPLEANNY